MALAIKKEEMIKTISKFNVSDVFQDPGLFVDLDVELTNIVDSNDLAKSTSIFAIKKDGIFGIAYVNDDNREEFFPEEMETLSDVYYRVCKEKINGQYQLSWTGEVRRLDDADFVQMNKTLKDILQTANIPRTFITPQNKNYTIDDPDLIKILDEIFTQTYLPVIAKEMVERGFKRNKR
jgi:hypothetical protein